MKTSRMAIELAMTAACLSVTVAAADRGPSVSEAEMRQVYEAVATPFKYGVILAPEREGEMLDDPMVYRCGESWYMMYIRFDGRGYETHLAKSSDLLRWQPLGCILRRGRAGAWDSAQADGWPELLDEDWEGGNALKRFDGRYWMMYLGGSKEGYETDPLSTGVAWTDDATLAKSWQRVLDRPVLTPGDADARDFEKATIYKHFVVEDPSRGCGGRFVSFYNAKQKGPAVERIGMAVSDDMVRWRRFGAGPVVSNGKDGGCGITGNPMVRRIGSLWVMFYFGCGWGDGCPSGAFDTFACSRDLKTWTKWTGEPLIRPSEPWDKTYAHKPWVLKHEGVVYHFYCAVGDRGRCLALATSRPLRPGDAKSPKGKDL